MLSLTSPFADDRVELGAQDLPGHVARGRLEVDAGPEPFLPQPEVEEVGLSRVISAVGVRLHVDDAALERDALGGVGLVRAVLEVGAHADPDVVVGCEMEKKQSSSLARASGIKGEDFHSSAD